MVFYGSGSIIFFLKILNFEAVWVHMRKLQKKKSSIHVISSSSQWHTSKIYHMCSRECPSVQVTHLNLHIVLGDKILHQHQYHSPILSWQVTFLVLPWFRKLYLYRKLFGFFLDILLHKSTRFCNATFLNSWLENGPFIGLDSKANYSKLSKNYPPYLIET